MGTKQQERQLCRIIDARIERMNSALQVGLSEEKQIERRISDVGFRNELIDLINELIEMRKLAERLRDEEQMDKKYIMRLEVSADSLRTASQGYEKQG